MHTVSLRAMDISDAKEAFFGIIVYDLSIKRDFVSPRIPIFVKKYT